MDLSGKVALITGGARMGAAVAEALALKGCSVALTWRKSKASAQQTAAQLTAQGAETDLFQCDLSQSASIQKMLHGVERRFGHLNLLVNLASIYKPSTGDKQAVLASWDDHMNANARSAYVLSLLAAPLMKRSGGGRMVHISDWTSASERPRYKEYSAYFVSKAAIKAVVEALALELVPEILVNAIAPGPILPPKGLKPKEERAVRQATPLGHWGGAQEIAKAVLYLAETDFVTGETIRVDGGRHLC